MYIQMQFKNQEMCEFTVQKNGWSFRFVPEQFKTQEDVQEFAVKKRWLVVSICTRAVHNPRNV